MYLDDVSQSVMRELARIHKRKMAPLKKALESAMEGLKNGRSIFVTCTSNRTHFNCSEMDTLKGRKGGKVIVTFFNVQTMMMFGVLLDHKDAQSVTDVVARIHAAFLDVQYPMVFGQQKREPRLTFSRSI